MMLTAIGWVVVHSLWQGTFIAGLAALAFGLIREPRARTRYVVACASLALMVAAPLATALTGLRMVRSALRPHVIPAIEGAIGFPPLVWWGSIIIPVIGAVWIAGVIGCVIQVAREVGRARSLRRLDLADAGDAARQAVTALTARMSIAAAVEVRASGRAAVPMVLGWRRPLILLPAGATRQLRDRQLRGVLAHELAHVGRGDYLANLLQLAADTLLVHHPAARWVSRRIRTEREYCCDDAAVRAGADVAEYARALAALEDARAGCRLAVAAGSGTLLDRLQRLVGHPRRVWTPGRGAVALLAASLLAAAMLALAMTVPPSLPFGSRVFARSPRPAALGAPPAGEMPTSGERRPRSR
jgi:beta-lactamase regulating signal transducer with metallopeptidase domain